MRIFVYFFLLFCCFGCATAQPTQSDISLSKKETKAFNEARSAYDTGNYLVAATTLDDLLARQPKAAKLHYLRGLTYRQLGQYPEALQSLQKGKALDANPSSTLFIELGQLQAQLGDFDASLSAYKNFLESIGPNASSGLRQRSEERVRRATIAAEIARNPVSYHAEVLPGRINTTSGWEYFPSLSTDGQSMVFTRRENGRDEDFYRSDLLEDGSWSEARPLNGVNTDSNEGAQTISADGNFLVFTACGRPVNRGSCDLYYSERVEGGGWTPARNLGPKINTDFGEKQPSLSADGNLLFFSSDRAGGVGGEDLYLTARLPDNRWSEPVNLGPTINTTGNENFPFWAADGKTLFFTSNAHPGLGGSDLFRSDLSPTNEWNTPVNLGYPINSAENETNLFIGLDGKTTYFSKEFISPGTGKRDIDIYSFELPEALRPDPATYLAATVVDAVTKTPLTATVRVSPLDESTPPRAFVTSSEGFFQTVLPTGKDFAVTVEREGYLFYSDRFVLTGALDSTDPFEVIIELQPVPTAVAGGGSEEDGSVAFRNVLFETGSATLLAVSGQELDRLVAVLTDNPALDVQIAGHTDDVGEEDTNQRLSEARANSVAQYLAEHGIDESRITTIGFGESRPVAGNDTEEGRSQNRRTTFRLVR